VQVSNTYYLPFSEDIPRSHEERAAHQIHYYQWISLILALQAFTLIIPALLWRLCNGVTSLNIDDIVETSTRYAMYASDPQRKHKGLSVVARMIDRTLSRGVKRRLRRLRSSSDYNHNVTPSPLQRTRWTCAWRCCCCCSCFAGKDCGSFLTVAYVVCKVLSVAMPIANLLAMDVVLGNVQYWRYGIDVLWAAYRRHIGDKSDINDVIFDDDERHHQSGGRYFPRVTLCDLDIRSLGNVNRYTIQCVLTANLFIERMYIILWFVFVALALTSLVGLVVFLVRISRHNRQKYVAKIFRSLPMTNVAECRLRP
jgi:hypothetical protein